MFGIVLDTTGTLATTFGVSEGTAILIFILVSLWSLAWKGVALWKSARLSQRNWFIALLVINTLGILEIIYIFLVAKKKESQVTSNPE